METNRSSFLGVRLESGMGRDYLCTVPAPAERDWPILGVRSLGGASLLRAHLRYHLVAKTQLGHLKREGLKGRRVGQVIRGWGVLMNGNQLHDCIVAGGFFVIMTTFLI